MGPLTCGVRWPIIGPPRQIRCANMLALRYSSRFIRSTRGAVHLTRRNLLTERFSLNEEWALRHQTLDMLALGGDYEWVAAVQKKFLGGGTASAVDVDAAVCAAEEKDQLEDLIDLVYRLRHTSNTADTLQSTEYALVRTILKHNAVDWLFKLLNDTINYGVFLNEHSACLAIDHLLETKNFAGAARVVSFVMQQEMFSCELLNLLSVYATLRCLELPPEQRVFATNNESSSDTSEDDSNEEDVKIMRLAYLKNEYSDDHYDIVDTDRLLGKTLLWMLKECSSLSEKSVVDSVKLIGTLLYGHFDEFAKIAESGSPLLPSAIDLCRKEVQRRLTTEGESNQKFNEQLLEKLDECTLLDNVSSASLCSLLEEQIRRVQPSEEKKIMDTQKKLFKDWTAQRVALISAQVYLPFKAEALNCRLRIKEIKRQKAELEAKREMLYFFENRMKWEDQARRKDQIFNELKDQSAGSDSSEEQYSATLFEKIDSLFTVLYNTVNSESIDCNLLCPNTDP
ncbi:unnamed protein product [Anisakis simplex]|uniref:Mitochondrial 28S ribosomal protein S27 n=1 Tax=Anisakis simplex TaxID=6269 RepID=A0A158PMW8_ANISI|nr:unnamed protein product [Anisakis simplex]